jgi:subtilisin-like proprotein convertase family protein
VYWLREQEGNGGDNIDHTYMADLSAEAPNGNWRLRVQDTLAGFTGRLDRWDLNLAASGPLTCTALATNGADIPIPLNGGGPAYSPVRFNACSGKASSTSTVELHSGWSQSGMTISLIAPDGSEYVLSTWQAPFEINEVYRVNLSSETRNGLWRLKILDRATYDPVHIDSFTLDLAAGNPRACSGGVTNDRDVEVPDYQAAESTVAFSDCIGRASNQSTVEVHIDHPRTVELVVSLIAPDGTVYVLRDRKDTGNAIDEIYTVNLYNEVFNGTWTLRVLDTEKLYRGHIDSFTLDVTAGAICYAYNGVDVPVADGTTGESALSLSSCDGLASTTSTVEVHLAGVNAFDVVVSLIAPSGAVHRLSGTWHPGDPTNVDTVYTLDLSKEIRNGKWRLQVEDLFTLSSGYIDTWTLRP